MKLKTLRRAPIYIAAGVVGAACLVQVLRLDCFERLEDMTYDWRVRLSVKHSPEVSTNLGFVSISDTTIDLVDKGMLERPYGLYWPRHVYGRVAAELAAQGAKAVAFDVLFPDLRPDHAPLTISASGEISPDEDFAMKIRDAGNVILAAEKTTIPPKLFRTNALALGDITVNNDLDGVLRRTRAFRIYRKWHPAFEQVESDPDYVVDLNNVRIEPDKVVLLRPDGLAPIEIPLSNGLFDLRDFTDRIPRGMTRFSEPFTDERVWDMGIVLAAQALQLDLDHADVDLKRGRITLNGPKGMTRVIPVDKEGYFYIDWALTAHDQRLEYTPFEGLLAQYQRRVYNSTNEMVNLCADRYKADWKGKLVVIGSEAIENDLTDHGPTPLSGNSILVSKHWNVANSVLTGRFVRRSSLPTDLLLTLMLGLFSLVATYSFRSYIASLLVLVACLFYVELAVQAYDHFRYWLPMVLPLGGGLITLHACMLVYLVFFEQLERHRLKAVFTKMVSPDVVNEVLKTEKLPLSGARRNVTVLFADIRGFTEMTDVNLERAAEYVKGRNLTGDAAEAVFEGQSRETLATVNLYLKVIAETVLKHNGTVDKFIGDCVMAFWGAPIPNQKHALACVRSAVDVQRAVYRLNLEREAENRRREEENLKLAEAGQPLLQPLPVLSIGSGVNTGVVTVGLMGSNERVNYTVFGRDVNLASRLESYSGRGRIIISEATLAEIIQDDPSLALSCTELPAVHLKGFRTAIPVYEVPWREPGDVAPPAAEPVVEPASEPKPAALPAEADVPFQGGAGGAAA